VGRSPSGGGTVAGSLIESYLWTAGTRATREMQWRRWEQFCEEDERDPIPADPRGIVAYLGWLHTMGTVAAASRAGYVSAVSMYHILNGYPSPSRGSDMVAAVLDASVKAADRQKDSAKVTRGGVPAHVMRKLCEYGVTSLSPKIKRDAAFLVVMFTCGLREASARALALDDVLFSASGVRFRVEHRKGKLRQAPQWISYESTPAHGAAGPIALFREWFAMQSIPTSSEAGSLWWTRPTSDSLPPQHASRCLHELLPALDEVVPAGSSWSSHSLRIGASTSLQLLGVPEAVVLRRLGWTDRGMMSLYFDERLVVESADHWMFAQFLPSGPPL
jgi:hypothetical protein